MAKIETKIVTRVDGKKVSRDVIHTEVNSQRTGERHLSAVQDVIGAQTSKVRAKVSI